MSCSDRDSGANAALTYSITSGDDAEAKFSVSGYGVIQTTSFPVDYEATPTKHVYVLVVEVSDSGTAPLKGTAKVIISVCIFIIRIIINTR